MAKMITKIIIIPIIPIIIQKLKINTTIIAIKIIRPITIPYGKPFFFGSSWTTLVFLVLETVVSEEKEVEVEDNESFFFFLFYNFELNYIQFNF